MPKNQSKSPAVPYNQRYYNYYTGQLGHQIANQKTTRKASASSGYSNYKNKHLKSMPAQCQNYEPTTQRQEMVPTKDRGLNLEFYGGQTARQDNCLYLDSYRPQRHHLDDTEMRKALKYRNRGEEGRKRKNYQSTEMKYKIIDRTKTRHKEQPTSRSQSSSNIIIKPSKPLYTPPPPPPPPKKLSNIRIQCQLEAIKIKQPFIIDTRSQTDSCFSEPDNIF